jgi:hypothetical protein
MIIKTSGISQSTESQFFFYWFEKPQAHLQFEANHDLIKEIKRKMIV